MTFICIIGHFEDDDIGLQLPEFIEHFCFLIYICPSRWDLSNNSPNLHQKTTNWRILVVIVKWCHHSMYCPVAIIWGIFPVNTSQLIFNLNFFYYTGLYIRQTNSAPHVLNFSFTVFYLESRQEWSKILFLAWTVKQKYMWENAQNFVNNLKQKCNIINFQIVHGRSVVFNSICFLLK